jgi:hypothetical protein
MSDDKQPELPLFSKTLGEVLRDEAIAVVTAAAPAEWLAYAEDAVVEVARRLPSFTTDDVWQLLKDQKIAEPPEPRAMAGPMKRAQRGGLIRATDESRRSIKAICHRRRKSVWLSLICETTGA